MKKQNTWMTIALGGLVTLTVAAVAIVWSGTWTKENPDSGLESTNRPGIGNAYADETEDEEQNQVIINDVPEKDKTEAPADDNPLHGRWEVGANDYPVVQKPDRQQVAVSNPTSPSEDTPEEVIPAAGSQVYSLNFAAEDTVGWPVQGNVIQHYSMDTTVYFPTLEQYKCSPAIEIQSEAGTVVTAPTNAKVAEVGEDVKIGKYVRMELGNDYQIILGQLTDICVAEGDYVSRGAQIGTVAAPTRYFVVEGDHLYFQMLHGEQTVDPLDYLE